MGNNGKKVKKKRKNDFMFVAKHIKFAWMHIILALVASIVATAIAGLVPDMTAQLFDGNFEMSRLWTVIGYTLLSTAITAVGAAYKAYAEAKSLLSARQSAWRAMIYTNSKYYDEHDPASLLSMVTIDMEQMSRGIVTLCTTIPTMFTMVLTSLIMILGYDAQLLKVFWVIIPMHFFYMFFVGRWQKKLGKDISAETGKVTGYLAERIRNMMMIRSFSAQDQERQNGLEATGRLYQATKKYWWLNVIMTSYASISGMITTVVTVLWGCNLLSKGVIDLPTFIGFQSYVAIVTAAFVVISLIWSFVKDFQGRAFRLARLLESPKENEEDDAGIQELPDGDIEVRNLSFAYNEEANALTGMNFVIPRGKVTAIVGPSGSGKTTMIKLLERLYQPSEGEITIGSTNIQELNLRFWRHKLAYVVQDAGVFGGTVREALSYGSEEPIPDETLMQTVDQVGLRSFVEGLPQQLDTQLGTWGATLSGGQRQRIVIARALLQDADILIFDEPTSALDPETAGSISNMILEKFHGKTVIVISHELQYIAAADHIVVINQGTLEGSGSHSALMEKSGVYRDLVQEQSYQEVFGA